VDYRTWTLVLNTVGLTAATCAVSLPLGTALAWLLVRTDLPGRRGGLTIVGLLPFVPLYLLAAAWQAGFGLQGWCMLSASDSAWLARWGAAVWIHALAAVPWVALIVGTGLRLVEAELEEQALLDGSPRQVFFRVTLRGALPAVAVAALWTATVTAGEMTVTDLFVIRTYAEEVYTRAAVELAPRDALRAALPGMAVIALLVAAGLALCAKLAPRDRPASLQRARVFALGRMRTPAVLFAAVMLLLLVAVPLGNLLYQAGVRVTQTETGWLRSWSLGKCLLVIAEAPWRNRREFGWSLLIGPCAATAAVAAAAALAWWARRGGLRALAVLALTVACLAVPGPVLGLTVIAVLNRPEWPWLFHLYDHSILAPWLVLSLRALPAATLILWHAFRTIPADVLESAALDGAGPLARMWHIVLPLRIGAIAVAWLVALAVALGDLAASILVLPPGVATIATHLFGLLHFGVEDRAAGMSLALLGLLVAVGAAARWLWTRWGGGPKTGVWYN
jgi:iron(III) transport system permease protein